MNILRLHIHNLNSLRLQATIDFTEPPLSDVGIFAITGPTGAGKSTILDAITLALYGKVARGKEVKEVISYGATECLAEVEFKVDEDRYLASWRMHRARRRPDGNLIGPSRELAKWDGEAEAFLPIAEKIKEVDEVVEEITGLDYDRFTRSVLLSQGDFAAFLRASDKERSDLLERITGTAIYSELSVAAFERHRLARRELEQAREALRRMEEESEEAVTEEALVEAKAASRALEEELSSLRTRLQRLDRWREALRRQATLETEQANIGEKLSALQRDKERLQRSVQLRPIAPLMDRWAQEAEREGRLSREIEQLRAQREEIAERGIALQAAAEEAKKAWNQHRLFAQAEEKKLLAAEKLEQEAKAAENRVAEWHTESAKTEQRLRELQELTAAQEKDTEALTESLRETQEWLAGAHNQAALVSDLPRWEAQIQQLSELEQSRAALAKDEAENIAILDHIRQGIEKWERRRGSLDTDLQATERAFRTKLPTEFDPSQAEALERFSRAIEQTRDRKRQLQQLADLEEGYQRLLREQSESEERLAELLAAQQRITKELLSNVEEREAWEERLQYRRRVYEQQIRIANYEKDRQNLQPGEPCPLCQSVHHPFRDHPITPFVDEAEAELKRTQLKVERLQVHERQLLRRENEFNQEIELLRGHELDPLRGRLRQQVERLLEFERRFAGLVTPTENGDLPVGRGSAFTRELERLDQRLQTWHGLREELGKLLKRKETLQSERQETEGELIGLKSRLAEREELAGRLAKQRQEAEERLQGALRQLNAALLPFQQVLTLDHSAAILEDLRAMARHYQERLAAQREAEERLGQLRSDAQHRAREMAGLKEQRQEQEEQRREWEQKFTTLSEKKRALLGQRSVEEAREALRQAGEQAERERDSAQAALMEVEKVHEGRRKLLAAKEQEARELASQHQTTEAKLTAQLAPLGYAQAADAQFDLLPADEERDLTETLQRLEQEEAATARALKDVATELDKLADVAAEAPEESGLRASLQTAEAEQARHQQAIGRMEAQLERQAKRKAATERLRAEIEQKREDHNRWYRLNEVIGQADGKKFRSFAQGLTLRRLVALANQHLMRLHGRYRIHKRNDADLELEIVDTYQADNRRGMFTLSGGETFLVSLALALGLSDLAGRNAQIHSLFIDEGFGTLDENSLDLALGTLENLQSRGKTIGVISHVKLLQERIGAQIRLNKSSSGFSTLELVG